MTTEHQDKLFELIEGIDVAMLVSQTADGLLRSRPMVTRRIENDQRLWFLTDRESTKVFEISNASQINVSFAKPENNTFVSVSGTARVVHDRERIDQIWMPMAKAWFPGGKDDPNLTLIEVTPSLAEYWDEPAGNFFKLQKLALALASGTRVSADYADNEKVDLRHNRARVV